MEDTPQDGHQHLRGIPLQKAAMHSALSTSYSYTSYLPAGRHPSVEAMTQTIAIPAIYQLAGTPSRGYDPSYSYTSYLPAGRHPTVETMIHIGTLTLFRNIAGYNDQSQPATFFNELVFRQLAVKDHSPHSWASGVKHQCLQPVQHDGGDVCSVFKHYHIMTYSI